jgi:hypothetical protein
MTIEWPSSRTEQKETIDQLLTDLRDLERKYIAATATTTEKELTHSEVREAWDILYPESPVFDSRVLQFDPTSELISGVYKATPLFGLVSLPAPDPSWELIDEFYMDHTTVSADFTVTIPQNYEKIVVVGNARISETSTNAFSPIKMRVNAHSGLSYYDGIVYLYKSDTANGLGDALDVAGGNELEVNYSATDNAYLYDSGGFMLEFPTYYKDLLGYTMAVGSAWIMASKISDPYYLQLIAQWFGLLADVACSPITSITFHHNLTNLTAFLIGTNIQVYGVHKNKH